MAPIWDEQRLSAELDAYQEWLDERADEVSAFLLAKLRELIG